MNNIQIFSSEQFGQIRAMERDGEPWFVAADVCRALEISNNRDALSRLDDDEKGVALTDTPGGQQEMSIINEPGLYGLVLSSRKKEAKVFKRWIKHDVLPSIRKHGMYATPVTIDAIIADPDFGIKLLMELKTEQKRNAELQAKVEIDAPKVLLADSITASNQTILIGQLAKILHQNGMKNIGQNRLFERLRNEGYLGTSGDNKNIPTQRAMDMGLFRIKKSTYIDKEGRNNIATTVKVTGKGIQYFVNKYLGKKNYIALEGDSSK